MIHVFCIIVFADVHVHVFVFADVHVLALVFVFAGSWRGAVSGS